MEEIVLKSGKLELRCLPAMGGSVTGLSIRDGDAQLNLMRQTTLPLTGAGDVSSFSMGPWVGRIKDGLARVGDRTVQLLRPEKHSIHGVVREVPWELVSQTNDEVSVRLNSASMTEFPAFPFPFEALLKYSLSMDGYRTTLQLTNIGTVLNPYGWGFHPYFPANLPGSGRVTLRMRAGGVFRTEGIPIPESAPVRVPPDFDFQETRELRDGFDTCFTHWSGEAELRWPGTKHSLKLHGSPEMKHLVLFTPPGKPFVAVEPMSTVPNAVNLDARGVMPTNLSWLSPGESFEIWYDTLVS